MHFQASVSIKLLVPVLMCSANGEHTVGAGMCQGKIVVLIPTFGLLTESADETVMPVLLQEVCVVESATDKEE